MLKDRQIITAQRFNITDKVKAFENELMAIPDVLEIEFDLDGFYDDLNQVIILVKYNISTDNMENYFQSRRTLISNVISVAAIHGLKRTEDRIEDYGEHFYFVFEHDSTWKINNV